MRRAVASSLLLAVLATTGLVCPCPPANAAAMKDDHGCCSREGMSAAASCCLTAADAPKPASLDAPPAFAAPEVSGAPLWRKVWIVERTAATPAAGADADAERLNDLIDALLSRVTVVPLKNTRLVNLQVWAHDPKLAALLANTLADLYIEQSVSLRVDSTRREGSWLSEQAVAARRKLEEAERALQRFNEQNNIISLEQRQSLVLQKLEELNAELTRARTARMELDTRVDKLQALRRSGAGLEDLQPMPQVIGSPVIQAKRAELSKLEGDLVELSKVYTAKHPKIIGPAPRDAPS